MLRLSFFVAFIVFFSACKSSHPSEDLLSQDLDPVKAQRDFSKFRDILEKGHPALTAYITEERKDFVFDSVYKTIHGPLTLRGFYTKLSFLVNEIGCSHTALAVPSVIIDSLYDRKLFFPFPVILMGHNLLANSTHVVAPGTKILAINGVTADRVLDSLTIFNPVDGMHRETQKYLSCRDFGYDYFTRFGGKDRFEILVKDTTGRIETIYPDAITLNELNDRQQNLFYYDVTDVPYSLSFNEDFNYALLRLTTFEFPSTNKEKAFENFLKNSFELLSMKKNINTLIIDIRENGGGDLYNCFLLNSYLCRQPFREYKTVSCRIKKIPYHDLLSPTFDAEDVKSINNRLEKEFIKDRTVCYELPDSLITEWMPDKNHFSKNIVVVTNSTVVSAASYFTTLAKSTAGAKVIGVETSGSDFSSNGFAALKYTLPESGIGLIFSYANFIYSTGNPKTGKGIIPDYTVPDNYESFKNNKDQQLIFIIDSLILKNNSFTH
jgi:hypothetical protein